MTKAIRNGVGLGVLVVTVAAICLLWNNRYNISDWLVLRNYTPPVEIVDIANQAGMNDYGKRLFYVKQPQISDRASFAQQCTRQEQTIVLGCYTGFNIYIFNVDDPRLVGVKQVTAAHEMLHSAYDRLSESERQRVDALIVQAFNRISDPRIKELAASYQRTEPGSVPNELHSILGTEVANLGPELEQYFSQYFADRGKIVALAERYQSVFNNLKNEVERLDAELALRKNEIDRLERQLQSQNETIAKQRSELDRLVATRQLEAYNAAVPTFNASVDAYNSGIAEVRNLIDQYNSIVEQRNGLGLEQQSLAKSIDSRLQTINQ